MPNLLAIHRSAAAPPHKTLQLLAEEIAECAYNERMNATEMPTLNSVAAIYDTHVRAEKAVKELQEAGVDMKTLSQ